MPFKRNSPTLNFPFVKDVSILTLYHFLLGKYLSDFSKDSNYKSSRFYRIINEVEATFGSCPNTTTIELMAARNKLGAEKSWTNYSYYFGV